MTKYAVDPDIFYSAAKTLLTLIPDIETAVTRDLLPGMPTSPGMGGNYPAAEGWNKACKFLADEVRDAVLSYTGALHNFSDILNVAGYNWHASEWNADISPDRGAAPSVPALGSVAAMGEAAFPKIVDSRGDNGAGLEMHGAGDSGETWEGAPNARTGALATAASAWNAFASCGELATAVSMLRGVHDSFNGVQAPEIHDVQEALDALCGGVQGIATSASVLATAISDHHDNLPRARQALADAAPQAFPAHRDKITTSSDDTSVTVTVGDTVSANDINWAYTVFTATANGTELFTYLSGSTDAHGFRYPISGPDVAVNLPKLKALTKLQPIVANGSPAANFDGLEHKDKDGNPDGSVLDILATWSTPASTLTPADLSALDQWGPQMKSWAMLAVKYGNQAGVDPRLVLAMALQEGAPMAATGALTRADREQFYNDLWAGPASYHPNPNAPEVAAIWDKAREEIPLSKHMFEDDDPGNSIGLTNQKKGPFDETAKKFPKEFAGQDWSDLPGNDDLAMKAAAYNLRRLQDAAVPGMIPGIESSQTHDQFLGSAYNAGGMNDDAAKKARGDAVFGPKEAQHGQSTISVAELADKILCQSGAYR